MWCVKDEGRSWFCSSIRWYPHFGWDLHHDFGRPNLVDPAGQDGAGVTRTPPASTVAILNDDLMLRCLMRRKLSLVYDDQPLPRTQWHPRRGNPRWNRGQLWIDTAGGYLRFLNNTAASIFPHEQIWICRAKPLNEKWSSTGSWPSRSRWPLSSVIVKSAFNKLFVSTSLLSTVSQIHSEWKHFLCLLQLRWSFYLALNVCCLVAGGCLR